VNADAGHTKPFHPQTNGMVERFNRRISDAVGREPKRGTERRHFASNEERDAFVMRFINNYNHTRLKCLGYKPPLQTLANLAGPYTPRGDKLFLKMLWDLLSCLE
jgi:transposase InsO family protein